MKTRSKTWRKWTEGDLSFLRTNYSGMPLEYISRTLGRTTNTVKTRAHMIGLSRWNPWTDKELTLLKQLYPSALPWSQLIQRIGRTEDAIRCAASNHQLKRPRSKGTLRYMDGRKKYRVMPNGCWQWIATRDENGYPKVSVAGRNKNAHRQVYEDEKGSIPDGLEIDHLCRNRSCVNPSHLEAVTKKINIQRSKVKR